MPVETCLPCPPNPLRGGQQVALSITRGRTDGCSEGLSLQGSNHGGEHGYLLVPLIVMLQPTQSTLKWL